MEAILAQRPEVLEGVYRRREAGCEPAVPPFAVRLDGVGFGSRLASFPPPRSPAVHAALVETAREVAMEVGAELVHVVSDEINLVFLSSAPYGGRAWKIVSVLASAAAARLTARLMRPLHFDGRVIRLEGPCDAARYLLYRARVGFNNYVIQMARAAGLVKDSVPPLAEMLRHVKAEGELAWGTTMSKGDGYAARGDPCAVLASLCPAACQTA